MTRFDSFVMFAAMRTGSNYLEANLNALPGVRCHGELFNPSFIGGQGQTELLGFDMAAREADPLAMLQAVRAATPGLAGFRYFHDHDPRVLEPVLFDPRCAKIILTRNPLESYVSWKIARATGQWTLTNARRLKTATVRFDPPEFERHLEATQDFQLRLLHGLQVSGQGAFYVDYEDLQDLEVLNGLARFLGLPAGLAAADATLKKQNPGEIAAKVENPEEMAAALARLDRFNLARTPNFEPRRAPGIPGFVAAQGAGLLYLPLRGGPEAAVRDWLGRLGQGLLGDFTQKTLRDWKRKTLPHRSFTVLRHPLARAHAAFCSEILTGALPELRSALQKTCGLRLPPPGEPQEEAAHREAFLGFLRFLRLNLSGQTGLRVDAHFASQTAVLQGFARFQTPDAVLREAWLAEGLAALAAEVGAPSPVFRPMAEPAPHALAAIHGDDLEEAAREAYLRDYVGFGFGPWRAEAEA
ncbi:nodulation protein NodH [Cereibacter changlensis]|uniref:nodulation protein NodH n=1 Tax=Cereibacter changlensis TaxID=402884 RepID=UPI0040332EFF